VNLADQVTVRCVAAHAVLAWVGPPHAAPHIALDIDAYAVSEARREIVGEDAAAAARAVLHCKHAYVRWATMRGAAIHNVEQLFVGRQRKAIWTYEII
jgi:hypothetical protein